MLSSHIKVRQTYIHLLKDPVWHQTLDWIQKFDPKFCPEGEHEIRGHNMYAIVKKVTTKPRSECRFESHQKYIDLQYCVSGFERIEWEPSPIFQPNTKYDEQKDVLLYPQPPRPMTTLLMNSGTFAIFFPGDAHMPEINYAADNSGKILKIVIKIKVDLIKNRPLRE